MGKIKDEYNKYGNVIQTATNDLIDAENAAYEQLRQQNEQLERQRQADTQANIKTFTDYLNQGYNAEQAMLMAAQQNTVNAQKEAKQQVDADRKAAKWTGLTELAASIANLVGVGQGAVSQNYRQYSQDWMQKADRDMHYHRARIDNLKERQRALQQRQQQLKLQNNLTLAQMQAAARKESTDAQQRLAEQQAAHARNIAGLQYKGTQAAAEAALQGAEKQAHLDLQERGQNISAAQGWERIRMAKNQNTLAMIQQGYVPDAKAPGGFRYDPDEAKAKYNIDVSASGGGGGKGTGDPYDVTIDGKNMVLRMSKDTYQQALRDGKAELREDLKRITGAKSWAELREGAGRRGPYADYAAIINALNVSGSGEDDNDIIARFVEDHRAEVNEFNKHLYRVSSGSASHGKRDAGGGGDTGGGTGWNAGGGTGWNAGGVTNASAFVKGIHERAANKK